MVSIVKQAKVGMIWVAGRSPTLVSQNLKATTLTYLAIVPFSDEYHLCWRDVCGYVWGRSDIRIEIKFLS